MNFAGIYLCLLNVISILHNYCYTYLLVLGYFPLGLRIFTDFFFRDRIQHCFLQYLNMVKAILIFIITLFWVLLQPILQSIIGREMGVESLKLVSLNVIRKEAY